MNTKYFMFCLVNFMSFVNIHPFLSFRPATHSKIHIFVFVSSAEDVGPKNVRPIKMFSLNITIGCPACLSNMYLHTSAHPVYTYMLRYQCVPMRIKGVIIVIICALYCNVFSPVHEVI